MTWSSASGELAAELASAAEVDAEAALVARARTDPAAFEELYLRHQRAVWRYLRQTRREVGTSVFVRDGEQDERDSRHVLTGMRVQAA